MYSLQVGRDTKAYGHAKGPSRHLGQPKTEGIVANDIALVLALAEPSQEQCKSKEGVARTEDV